MGKESSMSKTVKFKLNAEEERMVMQLINIIRQSNPGINFDLHTVAKAVMMEWTFRKYAEADAKQKEAQNGRNQHNENATDSITEGRSGDTAQGETEQQSS